jgi:hypothetical protein
LEAGFFILFWFIIQKATNTLQNKCLSLFIWKTTRHFRFSGV